LLKRFVHISVLARRRREPDVSRAGGGCARETDLPGIERKV
jgi:hypothetical protein